MAWKGRSRAPYSFEHNQGRCDISRLLVANQGVMVIVSSMKQKDGGFVGDFAGYDAKSVANEFLRCAWEHGDSLTNMQLQKLVYIAHGYSLALLDLKLVKQRVEAWRYGPVIPTLYHSLRQYGSGLVTEPIRILPQESISTTFRALISVVETAYGRFSGPQLSTMTHREGTPWRQVYTPNAAFNNDPIDDELIKQHYLTLLHERAGINPVQA